MDRKAVSRLYILAAAFLFSTGGAAIKTASLTGWQVACLRSAVATIALLVMLPAARRRWTRSNFLVGMAYALTMVLYATANKLTTAANAIFLQSTAPLYVLLFAPFLLGERTRRRDLVHMLVLAGGMAFFFIGVETPTATAPDPARGNLLAAAAGLTWALTLLGLRWQGRSGEGAAGAVAAGSFLACLVTLPKALPFVDVSLLDAGVVFYLGVFQVGLAYVFVVRAVPHLPALETALLMLVEPVLNPVWAFLFHREVPGSWALSGGLVILVASIARTFQGSGQASLD